jgi:hypothetical protein
LFLEARLRERRVPADLQADPGLWSGCLGGAWREDAFLAAFEAAGCHGISLAERRAGPWRTARGIESRPVTVVPFKGKQYPCLERNQALVSKGPFRKVEDDDGHAFPRGRRIAVCDETFTCSGAPPRRDVRAGAAAGGRPARAGRAVRLPPLGPPPSARDQGPGLRRHHRGRQRLQFRGPLTGCGLRRVYARPVVRRT